MSGDGVVDKTHAFGVRIHCETLICPWARHLYPSCSRGERPL